MRQTRFTLDEIEQAITLAGASSHQNALIMAALARVIEARRASQGQPDPIATGEQCPYCGGDNITDIIDYLAAGDQPDIFQCNDCQGTWDGPPPNTASQDPGPSAGPPRSIRIRRAPGGEWVQATLLELGSGWARVDDGGGPLWVREEHCHAGDLARFIQAR